MHDEGTGLEILGVAVVGFGAPEQKPPPMGVPEPLLDVVRVLVSIDVAVMIAMKGRPPQG